jgi:hypothetical protein
LLRIGRQGQVEDIGVEQVNLDTYGREGQMHRFRTMLGNAALESAKKWTFNPPSTGRHVNDPFWDMRAPIAFIVDQTGVPIPDTYGQWEAYMPGPRESIPWVKNNSGFSSSPDAIPNNGNISQVNQLLQLMPRLWRSMSLYAAASVLHGPSIMGPCQQPGKPPREPMPPAAVRPTPLSCTSPSV